MVLADYNDKTYDYTKYWEGRDYESQAEFIALKKLLPLDFKENRSVIDIGGGFGRLLPIFSKLFGHITILDFSQKLLDKANENASNLNLKINTIVGDVNNLSSLVNRKYSCVSMIRVSHHLDDLGHVFEEVGKVLEDDGAFILEVANKMHFKSVLSNFLKGKFNYFNKEWVSIATKDVTFLNHHPKKVEDLLDKAGFKVIKKLSVSNLRIPYVKKILPVKVMISMENIMQDMLSSFYFGPSIFYKIVKKNKE